jgi:hypothetical protein
MDTLQVRSLGPRALSNPDPLLSDRLWDWLSLEDRWVVRELLGICI